MSNMIVQHQVLVWHQLGIHHAYWDASTGLKITFLTRH